MARIPAEIRAYLLWNSRPPSPIAWCFEYSGKDRQSAVAAEATINGRQVRLVLGPMNAWVATADGEVLPEVFSAGLAPALGAAERAALALPVGPTEQEVMAL